MTSDEAPPILRRLRVLDLGHQPAAAMAGSLLADLGADVIVIEHPDRKTIRTMLPRDGEDSLWWKVLGRGKRSITLDLSRAEGRTLFLALARDVDVVLENFRPGTLEKWRLGPEDLEAEGLSLVMLRISGYGQTGPARRQRGFGTAAEAMSGFANLNGEPDGFPTFPSTTLADGVAAVFGVFGLMSLVWSRQRDPARRAVEVVDLALFEGLFRLIPTQVAAYDRLGEVPSRPGNRLTSHGVLRNLYRTADERHFVVSAIGAMAMTPILRAVEAQDLIERLEDGVLTSPAEDVIEFLNVCDARIADHAREHTLEEVAQAMSATGAVFQTVYTMEEIAKDEQYRAREDLVRVPDGEGRDLLMQGVVPKFAGHRHEVRYAGRDRGADNAEVFGRLGIGEEEIKRLAAAGVI